MGETLRQIDGGGIDTVEMPVAQAASRRHDVGCVDVRPPIDEGEWRQVSALLHDFAEWVHVAAGVDLRTEQHSFGRELDDLVAVYAADDADMFLALDQGLALGIVAVRYHEDRSAELKRLYVRRIARGRGIADRLAAAAIDAAASRGCDVIWLETMPGPMDPAISVYRRCGFGRAARNSTLDRSDTIVMERTIVDEAEQP